MRICVKDVNKNPEIYTALQSYAESEYYPCHMPGHKRNPQAGVMAELFRMDITEIDGFDNLHQPEGMLLRAQQRANALYGAGETFFLINGSTGGVLAAILAVTNPGDELLMMRGCHKSVYHAVILQNLRPHYLPQQFLAEWDLYGGVCAEDVEQMLEQYPESRAVVLTSPTYEGIFSEVREIAELVHRRGKLLIVDEAHGAHLAPRARLCKEKAQEDAIAAGADLVIHSLHKTLPSPTQTALLHVNGNRVDMYRLRKALSMMQSSSPSYLLMAGIDACTAYLEEHGAERFAYLEEQCRLFHERTKGCRHIRIGGTARMETLACGQTAWDPGKLVISVKGTDMTGQQLYDTLRERYHLQLEMAAESYALAMMTVMDTEEGWQRLADALTEIDGSITGAAEINRESLMEREENRGAADSLGDCAGDREASLPQACMSPSEAFYAPQELIGLSEAEGRIAGDFVNLYPPGIPLLAPGERIAADMLARLRRARSAGLQVQGISAKGQIRVIR